MSTFWDDDETVSEYELLEEAQEVEALAAQHAEEPVIVEANEDEIEDILEDAAFDLNEEEANIVYNTRIRLEQAKLYEMLINHDLFQGVEADPRAVAIVQNELKHYVVKRLEILMGLRQPVVNTQQSEFNAVETDFLRQLAYKGTNGRSLESDEDYEPELPPAKPPGGLNPITKRVKSSDLKPVVKTKPKGLDPRKEPVKTAPPTQTAAPKKRRAPAKKAAAPAPTRKTKKRTQGQKKVKVNSGIAPRDLNQAEIEAIAKADIENMKNRKPLHELKGKEKIEAIKEVNERHAKPKPSDRAPHLDANALQMKYMTEMTNRTAGTGKAKNPFDSIMANIANQIAVEKSKE